MVDKLICSFNNDGCETVVCSCCTDLGLLISILFIKSDSSIDIGISFSSSLGRKAVGDENCVVMVLLVIQAQFFSSAKCIPDVEITVAGVSMSQLKTDLEQVALPKKFNFSWFLSFEMAASFCLSVSFFLAHPDLR